VLGLLLLAWRFRDDLRRVLPYLAGAVSLVLPLAADWPLGYPPLYDNPKSFPEHPFALGHVVPSWTDSLIFDPRTLAILAVLAVAGALAVRRPWPLALLLAWTLVNPVFYSFYANTPQHPRFLYASLPSLFVLIAGLAALRARPG
jgi:hypothetical protein